jgi:hypothetical protein
VDQEKFKLRIPRIPRRALLAGLVTPLTQSFSPSREERERIEEARIAHMPAEQLEDLRARTSRVGELRFGDELSAGRFLVSANNRGMEVSAAILEMHGEHEKAVAPDLAEAQLYWLLSNSGNGNRLSRNERSAIVALSNWWPETFTPYYRDGDGLRSTLVEDLRRYPALERAFARYGRTDHVVAESGRTTD